MAGLQITPGVTGNPMPTAPTTRTQADSAQSVSTATTEIRTPDQRETSAVDEATSRAREREQADSVRESAIERREASLSNVVSRSEDGDTVQVSDDGATELEESVSGAVVSMTAGETEAARAAEDIEIEPIEAPEIEPIEAPEITPVTTGDDSAAERDITSFVGYTDQQVEQMYLEGEISQNDYNNEIARREEIEESGRADREKLSRDMGRLEQADSRNERADFALETATESGNDRVGLSERLQAVDDLFEDRDRAVRRQQEAGRLWDYQLQV